MAGDDKDQKTHAPTEKKLADAREKGDVPHYAELRHAAAFGGALLVCGGLGGISAAGIAALCTTLLGRADDIALTPDTAPRLARDVMAGTLGALLPTLGGLLACALVGVALQGRPRLVWSRVAPRLSKLSPFAGAKRLLGVRALVEFAKTLAKLLLVAGAMTLVLRPRLAELPHWTGAEPSAIAGAALAMVLSLIKTVTMMVVAIIAADILYQRQAWLGRMRMSLQEIKDEHKQSEGDPKIKAKIRAIGMQRSRRRMMAAVPGASVIVTNPTHYAVALKYDHGRMNAPVVVAKGVDAIALKIREVAGAAGVPIVENRPLARALYASVELDHPVPTEHYAAIAEIIGYVMRLTRKPAR